MSEVRTMSMISDDKLVRTPVRQSVREVQLRPDALVEKQSALEETVSSVLGRCTHCD